MTESTFTLTAAQAAARLGVKPATLYAYVSRGLLPRRRSPDGRASLFDPADVARLARRGSGHRGAPSDITVASELSNITNAGVWYRDVDVLRAARELHFEEVAWWLWTGSFERMNTWRSDARTLTAATRAQSALKRASRADRLPLIAAAAAGQRRAGTVAAGDVMACLVDALPGTQTTSARFAVRLASKLAGSAVAMPMIDVVDAALSLGCENGATYPAVVARLVTTAGGGPASAVAAALQCAVSEVRTFTGIESVIAAAANIGAVEASEAMNKEVADAAFSSDLFKDGDPRAVVLLDMLADAAPDKAAVIGSLAAEVPEPPTFSYAVAAVAWACGMAPGSAAVVALVSAAAGWLAHALEELRSPTPFRPRLAYTGPPPRAAIPRRPLDAVRAYLARQ